MGLETELPFLLLDSQKLRFRALYKIQNSSIIYSQSQKMQLLLLLGQGREGKEYAGEEENL